jgi:hypothetical protein
VAAPTTSLPERIGGNRNWDYRFCWVRDATLTLLALMNAGYYDEAQCWRDWLTRAIAGRPEQMEVMYGVAGERRLTEWEVPWLPGYERSSPVRIGNAAHQQLQLDVFGEVMDTLHQSRRGGLAASESAWDVQIALLGHLAEIWSRPDHGIWEVRTEPLHFTHSKAMAWVGFDRALKSAEMFGLPGDTQALARALRRDSCRRLPQGLEREPQQLRAVLRLARSRREPAAARTDRFPQAGRSALPRHRRGDRARPRGRRIGAALRFARSERRSAARRGRVPRLQLLAGRRLPAARPARRCRAGCSGAWSPSATMSAC